MLDPDSAFTDDLESVDPFYLGQIHRAVEQLQFEPTVQTRNRKRLKRPVSWCPRAVFSLRVGAFRILYRVGETKVDLLRLGVKERERLIAVRMDDGERS